MKEKYTSIKAGDSPEVCGSGSTCHPEDSMPKLNDSLEQCRVMIEAADSTVKSINYTLLADNTEPKLTSVVMNKCEGFTPESTKEYVDFLEGRLYDLNLQLAKILDQI